MAPRFLMLSERVLMNCLVHLMPYASQTRVSRPQKNWAMVEQVLFDVILGVWSSFMPGGGIESVLDAGWGCPCKKWA